MVHMWLEKTKQELRRYCSGNECQENPKYFLKTSKSGWRKKMKLGVTIACICSQQTEAYCPDCTDEVFKEMKKVFDRRLWILL